MTAHQAEEKVIDSIGNDTMRHGAIEDWLRGKGKSGVKGVLRVGQRWKAVFRLPDQVIQLGSFETVEEAYEIVRAKAIEVYGEEYAPYRFPKSWCPCPDP